MMECPRCGFSQPEDKYCANCGLDIESYQARPKPLLSRVLQNPNFYLFMAAVLIIGLVAYIVTSRTNLLGSEMNSLLRGVPLMSKQAADRTATPPPPPPPPPPVRAAPNARTKAAARSLAPPPPPPPPVAARPSKVYSQLDIDLLEISKDNAVALSTVGKILNDSENWRVIQIEDASKIAGIRSAGRALPGRNQRPILERTIVDMAAGDYNPNPQMPFLSFSLEWHRNDRSRWALNYELPPRRSENSPPSVITMDGSVQLKPGQALVYIFSPSRKIAVPSEETASLQRSPLEVLLSDDFQQGYSAMVIWIQFR